MRVLPSKIYFIKCAVKSLGSTFKVKMDLHQFLHYSLIDSYFSVGCMIPLDRPRFLFNDMVDICILDVLIISILELFHAFFHAHKRGKAHFSALMSMEKLHAYHLGL